MKINASAFLMATIVLIGGCGKKSDPEPSLYEFKLAQVNEKAAKWAAEEKTLEFYTLSYIRKDSEVIEPYWVGMDIVGGKVVCRQKVGPKSGTVIERGKEIGSHDWGNTPVVTLPEIYEECRRVLKVNPEAKFTSSMGNDLLWCEGNFGIDDPKLGVVSLGTTAKRVCKDPE